MKMTEQEKQYFADNLNSQKKKGECPPTYCGEVQEVKRQGCTVVARRAVYDRQSDQVKWNIWEVY